MNLKINLLMALPLLALGAISAGASILGQGINAYSQNKINERSEKFSREMYDKQRADSLSDWNMQNSYNDPSAQMKRLSDAGLNPHLVYGNGATTEAGAIRGSQPAQPNFKAPQLDLGSVVQQALATKQLQSNIARTDAETDAINSRTVSTNFQNQLNDAIGVDRMAKQYADNADLIATKFEKENLDFEAWKIGALDGQSVSANSPIVIAQKAGFKMAEQQLKQAKIQEDISSAVRIVKDFEANLTKQGIHPNSPWYVKLIGDLLMSSGLMSKLQSIL